MGAHKLPPKMTCIAPAANAHTCFPSTHLPAGVFAVWQVWQGHTPFFSKLARPGQLLPDLPETAPVKKARGKQMRRLAGCLILPTSHRTYHHEHGRLITVVVPHGKRKTCHPDDIRRLLEVLGL